MKTILAIAVLCLSVASWGDDKGAVSFSGKGKSGIEVRDASGQVTGVIGTSTLRLNQIPPDAVAREEAYRERQRELAKAQGEKKSHAIITDAKSEAEAAAAEEKAKSEATAAAAAEAKKQEEEHPRKVRRTTVRGTRYTPKAEGGAASEPAPAKAEAPAKVGAQAPAQESSPGTAAPK